MEDWADRLIGPVFDQNRKAACVELLPALHSHVRTRGLTLLRTELLVERLSWCSAASSGLRVMRIHSEADDNAGARNSCLARRHRAASPVW
jgi:hypothetical protein